MLHCTDDAYVAANDVGDAATALVAIVVVDDVVDDDATAFFIILLLLSLKYKGLQCGALINV